MRMVEKWSEGINSCSSMQRESEATAAEALGRNHQKLDHTKEAVIKQTALEQETKKHKNA